MKRGLVLEGGGAKGAFQFGALKALRDLGVHFDVVSGTSVGCLNGVLLATGNLPLGDQLWGDLRRSSAFLVRPVAAVASAFGIIARLFVEFLHGRVESDLPRALYLTFVLIAALPAALVFGVLCWLSRDESLFIVAWIGTMLIATFVFTYKSVGFRLRAAYGGCVTAVIVVWWWFAERQVPVVAVVLFVLPSALMAIAALQERLNLSIFAATPLRDTLTNAVASGFSVPAYATVAERVDEYFDPDDCTYEGIGVRVAVGYVAVPRSCFRPRYMRLDQLPAEHACNIAIASAALPFGIAQSRQSADGVTLVDGGVADNTPLYPLVAVEQCDEIFMILCNPVSDTYSSELRAEWSRRARLNAVLDARRSLPRKPRSFEGPFHVFNDPPQIVPLPQPATWPTRIVIIAPLEPLGSFLSATLNFSRSRALALQALGEARAREVLRRTGSATGQKGAPADAGDR